MNRFVKLIVIAVMYVFVVAGLLLWGDYNNPSLLTILFGAACLFCCLSLQLILDDLKVSPFLILFIIVFVLYLLSTVVICHIMEDPKLIYFLAPAMLMIAIFIIRMFVINKK